MPFVNIRTAKGLLSEEEKRELHRRIAEVLVEVEGGGNPDFRSYVSVLIEEYDPGAWSVHGEVLTAEAVANLRKDTRDKTLCGSDPRLNRTAMSASDRTG